MNEVPLRYKIYAAVFVLAATFAAGRYSVSGNIETKKVETAVTKDKTEHKKTVTDKKPTGEVITTITDDTDTKTDKTQKVTDTKTNAAAKRNILNVSALAANDFRDTFKPVYGVSVHKEVLGPVTLGMFGLNNGIVGVSIGIDF